MKKTLLASLIIISYLCSCFIEPYQTSASVPGALAPLLKSDLELPVSHDKFTPAQQSERQMFFVDYRDNTDTMLRMRAAGREFVHRDLEASVQSGRAVNFDLARATKAVAAVGVDVYIENLFSGPVEEISRRFRRRLAVPVSSADRAVANLEKILSDPMQLANLRSNLRKIIRATSDSPETMKSRNVIILLDGENDFFSLGFVLMHAGQYRGRASIYVHNNFITQADTDMINSVFEYGDRCLNADRALEDIENFRGYIKTWWIEWVRDNLRHSINRMLQHESRNGIDVSSEMNRRINRASHLSDLFGLWNEFRAVEILSRKGLNVLCMGESIKDDSDNPISEHDGLVKLPDGRYGIIETKSWNFATPRPGPIKRALVGRAEQDRLSGTSRYLGGKFNLFMSFYHRLTAGEKFTGIPDDFKFGEFIIMVDNEAVESVLYRLALEDREVRRMLFQFRSADIRVKCGFMPGNTELWDSIELTDLTELVASKTQEQDEDEIVIYSDRGIPLFGRAIDYYNACVRVANRNRGQIDMSQYMANIDGYEELFVKLRNIDLILSRHGGKVADTNIHIPDTLTWVDALIEAAPTAGQYIEKAISLNNRQGTKRFVGIGNSLQALNRHIDFCIENGEPIAPKSANDLKSRIKKARKLEQGKSRKRREDRKKELKQLDRIEELVKKACMHFDSDIEAVHTTRVFVHKHSKESEVAEGIRRVAKQLDKIVADFSSPGAREELGEIKRIRLFFDCRGHKKIRKYIRSRMDEITKRTHGVVKIEFPTDLESFADNDVNLSYIRNRLVPLLYQYSQTGLIRLFNVVYSRFVGLLFEMQGVEFLKYSLGYDLLAHGIEIYDPETDIYISELDAVLRDRKVSGTREKPVYKICEIRSCRTPLQFEKFLQERFYYKPETYESKRSVLNAKIKELAEDGNAEFAEVIFMLDVGRNFDFIDELTGMESEFSKTYGFPVKFIFLNSSPYGIAVASRHNLEAVDLVPADSGFIPEGIADKINLAA